MTDAFEKQWGVPLLNVIEEMDQQMRVVEGGRVRCCVGLLATFYFVNGDRPDVRDRVALAYEAYRTAIGDKLVWGADPKTGRPKKIAGTQHGDVRSWAPKVAPHEELEFVFHGGKDKNDADAYMTQALAFGPRRPGKLSYFTFTVPLAWLVAHSLDGFVKLVLDVCGILQPEHGYAGFGIIPHAMERGNSGTMTVVAGFARRFLGLEVDIPVDHAFELSRKPAIKGVNWLTVLGRSWVEKFGGDAALLSALGQGPTVHSFDGGVVVQAGPRPLLGDRNRNETLDTYRQVAKVLKPIRAEDIGSIAPGYGFDAEQTTAWLHRFDE
jgi:hypothetical protein